jgi:prepilin-type N-terminal cleavage/methylation domain-containing protein
VIRSLRRLRAERGYTLVEMLTVVTILTVVLTGLTTLFIQGSTAQLDMNNRFEAQQATRVALDKIRREIHCASEAETVGGTGADAHVRLKLPSQCPTANGVQTTVSWCTVNVATNRYALYRKASTSCDSTGVKWADYLTVSAAFDYQAQSATQLGRVRVELVSDLKPADATPAYELCDTIVLRNSYRATPTSSMLGYTDTADPAAC